MAFVVSQRNVSGLVRRNQTHPPFTVSWTTDAPLAAYRRGMETPEPDKLVPHVSEGATSHIRFHPEAAAIRAELHKRLNLNHRGRPKGKRKFPIGAEELARQYRPATQEELEALFGKGVTAWTPTTMKNA